MELIHRTCNICKSMEAIDVFQQRFKSIVGYSDREYIQRIVICKKCGHTYANPSPSLDDLSKYYETLSNYENPQRQGRAPKERINRWNLIYDLVAKKASPGKVLDIGCATGIGLSIFKSKGWDVLGIDPSPKAAKIARELYNVEVITGMFDTKYFIDRGPFDLIILAGVLEHLIYPDITISDLHNITAPDGLVFIEVPNLLSDSMPFGYFTFEHLNYFTPTTLANLMEMNGYRLEQIKILDASKDILLNASAIHGLFRIESLNNNKRFNNDYIAAYNQIINYKENLRREDIRLQSRIEEIINQNIPGKLGIWGAGIHTSQLLSLTAISKDRIARIFDSDPKKHGKLLNGIRVAPLNEPEEIKKMIDGIIISSFAFENEIYKQIEFLRNYGITIYKLYNI